jgi:antitoxin component YwqK of YwqJK toxin-antitoxin module
MPITKKTTPTGQTIIEYLNEKGIVHREDGPARTILGPDNLFIEKQEYLIDGRLHRDDGPALLWFYPDGQIEFQAYFLNGFFHRESGPAEVSYYPTGQVDMERYLINNMLHREDGPAYISYDKNGSVMRSVSCLWGKPQESFLNHESQGYLFIDGVVVLI